MAINSHHPQPGGVSTGRRFLVGTNVLIATVLLLGVVVVAQAIAYTKPTRWDLTSSGVNSLSDGTENLLRRLEKNIRLTSLYFETDREDQDQPKYRRAVQDLLALYEATNRAKVSTEWVNPLKDHEKYRTLMTRLPEKSAFAEQVKPYREAVETFRGGLDKRIGQLLKDESDQLGRMTGGIGESPGASVLAPIENVLMRWSRALDKTREQVEALTIGESTDFAAAVNDVTTVYRELSKSLKDISKYGAEQAARNPSLPTEQTKFLQEAGSRYADLVAALEGQVTKLQDLTPPKVYDLTNQLSETANALLVETDEDAVLVSFSDVWPPMQPGGGGAGGFKNRAFKGEEKLTSAVLRATHKEQTAVVFVRYGGSPSFMGGFMPGQPPAPYTQMKQQLEDANFIVEEWDLKSTTTPPPIEPKPTRTVYVVLKPTEPQRGPMGQQNPQDLPINEVQKKALFDAVGENGRAMFLAGWNPGMFPGMPGAYEYNEYLESHWGIKVNTDFLLVTAFNVAPGKYVFQQNQLPFMRQVEVGKHPIVSSPLTREATLPLCAPLEFKSPPPEGVQMDALIIAPPRDGVWGVKNVYQYIEQQQGGDEFNLLPDDRAGPFDLAAAAAKGESKIVVVSSRGFAEDQVAFAPKFELTSQGLALRQANPGNATLFINSLHWLNDNTQFMNIGKPIDAAVLQIGRPETVKIVQALTIFVWPALALLSGGVVWWIRRR